VLVASAADMLALPLAAVEVAAAGLAATAPALVSPVDEPPPQPDSAADSRVSEAIWLGEIFMVRSDSQKKVRIG
jgi:hypothetical protein